MKGFSYTSVSSFDTISGYSKEVSGFFYKLFFKKQINQACAPPGYTYHCEKRSPAEGRGARPFSTSGNLVRSGRFRIWDINSSRTTPTFSSLCFDSWKKNKINNSLQRRLERPQINHYINKQRLH